MNIQLINNGFDIYKEQDKSFSDCLSLQGDMRNDSLVQNQGKTTKKPKTKVLMNDNEVKFKNDFYGIFTWKKNFQNNWSFKSTNLFAQNQVYEK